MKTTDAISNGAHGISVVVLGLNHRRATLVLRECLSFPQCEAGAALDVMRDYVDEGAILSTCHRVELYAAVRDTRRAEAQLKRFWSRTRGVPVGEFAPHLYYLTARRAVEHLFNVAAGLDSTVVGEPQILGQVREALRAGLEHGSAGNVLGTLFQQAITCGKRARTETGIGRNPVSVSYAAVELARKTFGDLNGSRVLLVGAGKMGELAAKHLLAKGVAGINIVGRSAERTRQLALLCGNAVALSRLEDALLGCDIVITCTSAPHHVIHREMVERAMAQRAGRPLFLIDIAVPRDVDPAASEVPGVHLYNIDDLESAVAANMKERRAEAQKVAPIINEEIGAFEAWLNTLSVAPVIRALHERAEAIRREELERTAAVLTRLPDDDRRRIEALTLAIEKKLLHQPISLLRAEAAAGNGHDVAQALRRLFALDGAGSSGEERVRATAPFLDAPL